MAHLRARYKKVDGKKTIVGYAGVWYDPLRTPAEKYVSLRTTDKRVARRRLSKLEEKESIEGWNPWTDAAPEEGVLVTEAVGRYLAARSERRAKTQRADESLLNLFEQTLPVATLIRHVEERHVADFLDKKTAPREMKREDAAKYRAKKLAVTTRSTYHTRLRTFFDWCREQGLMDSEPMRRMKKPVVKRREKSFLTEADYERLIRGIEADATLNAGRLKDGEVRWLADVVRFAVGTGLRVGELCHLRWRAVDLHNRLVTVRRSEGFDTKSGHERRVPVEGEALAVLRRLNEQRADEGDGYVFTGTSDRPGTKERLNPEYVSKRFLHYARLAKLPEGVSFHTLRHTYVSWMIMKGVPVPVVKELAGHRDISTTMQYAHLAPDSLRDAVRRVFAAAGE